MTAEAEALLKDHDTRAGGTWMDHPPKVRLWPGNIASWGGGGTEGAALPIRVMVQFALGSGLHCDLIVPSRKAPDSRHDGG